MPVIEAGPPTGRPCSLAFRAFFLVLHAFGSLPAMLRGYSRLSTQELTPAVRGTVWEVGDQTVLSRLQGKQTSYLQCNLCSEPYSSSAT